MWRYYCRMNYYTFPSCISKYFESVELFSGNFLRLVWWKMMMMAKDFCPGCVVCSLHCCSVATQLKYFFLSTCIFTFRFFSQFIPKNHLAILNHDILTRFACYTGLKYSRGWQANLDLINNVRFKKKIGSTSKKWEQKKVLCI